MACATALTTNMDGTTVRQLNSVERSSHFSGNFFFLIRLAFGWSGLHAVGALKSSSESDETLVELRCTSEGVEVDGTTAVVCCISITDFCLRALASALLVFLRASFFVSDLSTPAILELDGSSCCICRNSLSSSFVIMLMASFLEMSNSSSRSVLNCSSLNLQLSFCISLVFFSTQYLSYNFRSLRTAESTRCVGIRALAQINRAASIVALAACATVSPFVWWRNKVSQDSPIGRQSTSQNILVRHPQEPNLWTTLLVFAISCINSHAPTYKMKMQANIEIITNNYYLVYTVYVRAR